MSETFDPEGRKSVAHLPGFVLRAENVVVMIAGVILFVVMIMTAVDVFGRYFFNQPLTFAFEMTGVLVAVMVFITLPSVTLRQEHISVGLFEHFYIGRLAALRLFLVSTTVAVSFAFLAWRMFLLAIRFYNYSDVTDSLKMPLWPVVTLGGIGISLAALAGAALAVDAIRRLVRSLT